MAQNLAGRSMELIIGAVIAAVIAAAMLPVALDELNAADTSNWDSSTATIYGLLGIFIVLIPVAVFANAVMKQL